MDKVIKPLKAGLQDVTSVGIGIGVGRDLIGTHMSLIPSEYLTPKEDKICTFTSGVNTLKASRWEFFKARVFGKKVITEDCGCKLTLLHYKGKYYHLSHEPTEGTL